MDGVAPALLCLEHLPDLLDDAPNCRAFVDAWLRWRGDKLVPTREDIRPEMLGAALQTMSVLQVESPEHISVRLVSAQYELLIGRPTKGANYVEMAAPAHRPLRIQRHQNIVNTPCGALTRTRIVSDNGLATVARCVILPVAASPAGPVNYVYNAADIERGRHLAPPTERDLAPLAEEFDYIDIGAGLPR